MLLCKSELVFLSDDDEEAEDPLLSLAIMELTLDSVEEVAVAVLLSPLVTALVPASSLLSSAGAGSVSPVTAGCLGGGASAASRLKDNLFTISDGFGFGDRTGGLGDIFL